MRLTIAAVGRVKSGPYAALQALYAERITWPLAIREVEERRKLPPAELKEREGALLLAAAPPEALRVPLDPGGAMDSSERFAARLAAWCDGGHDLAFLVGGADGLSAAARGSGLALSLGPATWPHFLARIMLLEQLYRAQQILAGHPYHRA